MAATHTISRRKPATYGKASRKPPPHQFSSSAIGTFPLSADVPPLESGTNFAKTKNILAPCDHRQVSQKASSSSEPGESQAELDHPKNLGDDNSARCVAKGISPWETSSSDEVDTGAYANLTRATKRRRISPPYFGAVMNKRFSQRVRSTDNDGFLSPVAASNERDDLIDYPSLHPSSSRALTDSLQRTSLSASTKGESGIRKPSEVQPERSCNSQNAQTPHGEPTFDPLPSGLQGRMKLAASASPLEDGRKKSHNERGREVASPTLRGLENASPPTMVTPHTPTGTRSSVEAATPRQRELWDMLLPKVIQNSSPARGNPHEPYLKDRPSVDHVPKTVESTDVLQRGTQMKRKASRLIDRLQAKQKLQGFLNFSHNSGALSDSDCEKSSISDEIILLNNDDPPPSPGAKHPNSLASDGPLPLDGPLHPLTEQHRLLPGSRLKVTYSSQRSHLATASLDDTSSLNVPFSSPSGALDDTFPKKGSRKKAPAEDVVAVEDSQRPEFDGSQYSSMRTIHELRESGENVRQMNDIEALFDDMDGLGLIPTSLRRSKLLELLYRLQEPACCSLLLDQGYDHRLLAMSSSKDNDAITDTLLASAMLYLVAAFSRLRATSQMNNSRMAELFTTRLKDDQDFMSIAQSRKSNISKRGQTDLKEYVDTLLHSSIWRSGAPLILSGRMVGLQGLDYLVRKGREAGCQTEILSPRATARLIEVLPSAIQASTFHPSADQLLETQLTVSILESSTISGANHDDSQWTTVTLAPILTVLRWLNRLSLMENEETKRLVLRLHLNLTNNNPRLCHEFAESDVIRSIMDVIESHFRMLSDPGQLVGSSVVLDTLILALGTLINLVEWSSTVRHTMITKGDMGECFLETLVGLFRARRKAVAEVYSEEETSSNVAFGYLSVLLAYISVGEEARKTVINHLEGRNLQLLLEAVEEFLQYHRQIDEELDPTGEMDLKTNFIGRLESVLARLRDVA
ncbi:MAG: hypothetical protein Q9225_000261 [Loekoesia sp. 1 TL-2023]